MTRPGYTGYDSPRSAHLGYGVPWGPGEWEAFLAEARRAIRNVRSHIEPPTEGDQA